MTTKRPPLSWQGIDRASDNRYARVPIGYQVSDGYQTALKMAVDQWHIGGEFDGHELQGETRCVNDADMIDVFGDE